MVEVFPHAEQRDDCFHALYEMNKVRRVLERRAYGAIECVDIDSAQLHRPEHVQALIEPVADTLGKLDGLCCNFEAPTAGWVVIWPDLEIITHHARR